MPSKSGTVFIGDIESEKGDDEEVLVPEKHPDDLGNLARKSGFIIFKAIPVFPVISSMRNKIVITPNRVTIIYNNLLSRDEYPMPLENVTGARVYRDFMFASLHIDTFGIEKPNPIKYLKPNDARLARRYILALIECKKAGVNITEYPEDELIEKLNTLGTVRGGFEKKDYHEI
jgi:hypothetical protein